MKNSEQENHKSFRNLYIALIILGLCIALGLGLGLSALGSLLGKAALRYKSLERNVVVKGLSEREYLADVVIWPIRFSTASNSLVDLYNDLDAKTQSTRDFLLTNGVTVDEITVSPPAITDKSVENYGNSGNSKFRYAANQTVTVYSEKVQDVRRLMSRLSELGKSGIAFYDNSYQIEYLFTRLNEVKPEMIEEATRKAREVGEKFAADAESQLGRIKSASQGQFSIRPRDTNNRQILKVRVVATIEYYLD